MHEELSGWSSARVLEPTDLGQTDPTWRVPAAGLGHSRFASSTFHVKHKLLKYLGLCITGLFRLLVMTTRRCGLFSTQPSRWNIQKGLFFCFLELTGRQQRDKR